MTSELDTAEINYDLDPEFRVRCNQVLRDWQDGNMRYGDATKRLDTLMEEAEAEYRIAHQGVVHIIYGIIKGYRGDYEGSIHHFEHAGSLFQLSNHQERLLTCMLNTGESYRQMGSYTQARIYFRKTYEKAKDLNSLANQSIAISNEGQMWLSLGNLQRAEKSMLEGLELSQQPWSDDADDITTRQQHDCEVYHALARLHLRKNDKDKAWDFAKRAYEIAQELDRAVCKGFACRAVAEVVTAFDESPDANFESNPDDYFDQSVKAFKEMKADAEIAHTLYAQGKSLAVRGKREQANRIFRRAMLIFSKLKMISDAAKAAEAQVSH